MLIAQKQILFDSLPMTMFKLISQGKDSYLF